MKQDNRDHIVIVGAGHAGGKAAETLRAIGHLGRITLLGNESYPPYERPPLSKALLDGSITFDETYLKAKSWYDSVDISLQLNVGVNAIDRIAQRVALSDGTSVPYDAMLMTTGARPRRLIVPGSELSGIFYLRDIADMLALKNRLKRGAKMVIIGAGFIGLEVAASVCRLGVDVTVLEFGTHVLGRVIPPHIAHYLADLHRAHGVNIRNDIAIMGIEQVDNTLHVQAANGETFVADLVCVGIGAQPNVELASAAGLVVDNGIVVDQYGVTSDPAISAAGDVTSHYNPLLQRYVRLESWQNAQNQAIAAAKNRAGIITPYSEIPWAWSDQYDVNLQIAGAPAAWDQLVWRGTIDDKSFTVFHLLAGKPVAITTVNNGRDMRIGMQLIMQGQPVDPVLLADKTVNLRELSRMIAMSP